MKLSPPADGQMEVDEKDEVEAILEHVVKHGGKDLLRYVHNLLK